MIFFRHEGVLKIFSLGILKTYFFRWKKKLKLRFWKSYTVDLIRSCDKSTKMTFRYEGVLKKILLEILKQHIFLDEKWKQKVETSILENKIILMILEDSRSDNLYSAFCTLFFSFRFSDLQISAFCTIMFSDFQIFN